MIFYQLERFPLSHLFNYLSEDDGDIKIFYRLFIISLGIFATTLRFGFIQPQPSSHYGRKNTTEAE